MARKPKTDTKPDESGVEGTSDHDLSAETSPPTAPQNDEESTLILEQADQTGVPEDDSLPNPERGAEDPPETKPAASDDEAPPKSATSPTAAPQERRRGAGFLTMLLGGIIAAFIGFGVSQYLGNDNWPFAAGPSDVEQQILGQSETLSELTTKVETLEKRLDGTDQGAKALDQIRTEQTSLQETVAQMADKVSAFDQRLSDLENRPIPEAGASGEAVAAYQEQLAGMRKMFQDELSRIEDAQSKAVAQEETAADRAQAALLQAAFVRMRAAMDSGTPFGNALRDLKAGGVEVPEILDGMADQGVPSLASLQQSFPAAARDALQATTRSQAESGEVGKFTAFLRTQLGARSLEPKEGTDPDAVLSRAEAALRNGDLSGTLSELQALPEEGQQAMADWMDRAKSRRDAVAATAALSDKLNN